MPTSFHRMGLTLIAGGLESGQLASISVICNLRCNSPNDEILAASGRPAPATDLWRRKAPKAKPNFVGGR
jgi:hypothetical protein